MTFTDVRGKLKAHLGMELAEFKYRVAQEKVR